jgi:hypothetical protein
MWWLFCHKGRCSATISSYKPSAGDPIYVLQRWQSLVFTLTSSIELKKFKFEITKLICIFKNFQELMSKTQDFRGYGPSSTLSALGPTQHITVCHLPCCSEELRGFWLDISWFQGGEIHFWDVLKKLFLGRKILNLPSRITFWISKNIVLMANECRIKLCSWIFDFFVSYTN